MATLSSRADVAELVDAHGSGPCGGNPVEVQVLSSAYTDPRVFVPTRGNSVSTCYGEHRVEFCQPRSYLRLAVLVLNDERRFHDRRAFATSSRRLLSAVRRAFEHRL